MMMMKILRRRIFEEKMLKNNCNILTEIVVVSEIDTGVVLFDYYHILRMLLLMVVHVFSKVMLLMSPALHDAKKC